MSDPTKIIKMLLPAKLDWIKEVVDVEHSGTVSRFSNSGSMSRPDEQWEEYEITIKIDYSKLRDKRRCDTPKRLVVTSRYFLENMLGYHEYICLSELMYEINILFTLDYKYQFKIVDSNSLQDRPF